MATDASPITRYRQSRHYYPRPRNLDTKGKNIAQWETEIDDRVAHLYSLTPEDLKIIRGD